MHFSLHSNPHLRTILSRHAAARTLTLTNPTQTLSVKLTFTLTKHLLSSCNVGLICPLSYAFLECVLLSGGVAVAADESLMCPVAPLRLGA